MMRHCRATHSDLASRESQVKLPDQIGIFGRHYGSHFYPTVELQ
jgi:hypothetical protein